MKDLNLIIVEDEPAIRQGIFMLVKRIDLPITITGTYSNGQEALDDLANALPDIVMTDVQMPVMSGLKLVETMKAQGYPAEYIILSGYAEFEYAQTALALGVHHYLLKSPRISELKETLSSLCDTVLETRYNKYRRYFQDLLFQQFHPHTGIPGAERLGLRMFLYTLGPLLEKLPEESDSYRNHISKTRTLKLITEHFPQSKGQVWILNGSYPNTKIILSSDEANNVLTPAGLYELLKQQTKDSELPVTLISLPQTQDISGLRDSYLYAAKYLQKTIQFGKSQLLTITDQVPISVVDTLSKTERDMLYKALSDKRVKLLVNQYRYFSKTWMEHAYSQAECTALTRRCLTEICRQMPGHETAALEESALGELFHITAAARSYEGFFDSCCQLIETILVNSSQFLGDSQVDDIVELLYQHIYSNFTKDVDVNTFARNHGYHPVYLITQFTRAKEISPNKLVIQLRMERAKALLTSTDLVLKDVADAVGYYDVSYFSRIFKEREGVSPGNYRKLGSE